MQLLILALLLFSLPHPVGFGATRRDPRRVLRASGKSCSHFNVYSAKSQVAQQTAIKAKGGPLRHQQVWPTGLANKFSLAVGPSTERGKPI
jgi:hypothetical protein